MKLLHIDSSILGQASVSRTLSADLVEVQRRAHPDIEVVYRDLAAKPLQHLSGAHLAAAQGATPAEGLDFEASLAALEEFLAADIIVIGAPMYNFTIPSQLKAWVDRVLVAGKTFRYGPTGVEGLLSNSKKVFIASSRGNVYAPGSPAAALEHHESYLLGVLSFIGLTNVTVVRAEGLAFGPEAKTAAMAKARESIAALVA